MPFWIIWPIKQLLIFYLLSYAMLCNIVAFYEDAYKVHSALYFDGHIMLLLATFILVLLPKKKR